MTTEFQEHSDLAPSSLYRLMRCPGSMKRAKKVPKVEQTAQASEGSLLHDYMRKYLEALDGTKEVSFMDIGVDDYEHVEQLERAFNYLCEEVNLFGKGVRFYVEKRVQLRHAPEVYGTLDLGVETPDEVHIFDWKFGRVAVEAENNEQLLAYLTGFLGEIGEGRKEELITKRWVVHIVQPRIDNFSSWVVTPQIMVTFVEKLQDMVKKALSDNAPIVPGDEQCKFCPAIPICPDRMGELYKESSRLMDAFKDKKSFDSKEVNHLLKQADQIKEAISQVQSWARLEMLRGNIIEEFKLVRGRGRRGWKEDIPLDKIIKALADEGVDFNSILYDIELKSPRQVLSKVSKESKAYQLIMDSVVMLPGPLKVVDASDPREKYDPDEAMKELADEKG